MKEVTNMPGAFLLKEESLVVEDALEVSGLGFKEDLGQVVVWEKGFIR